jgi:hypothetical protein
VARPRRSEYTADQIAAIDVRIARQCHPKQRDFVFDPAFWISLLCNRGAGKTIAAVLRLIRCLVAGSDRAALFIAETREEAERLAWRDLKRIVAALRLTGARFNESDLTLTLPNGSYLQLYGCDDKKDISKLRGVTWNEVIVDETASIKNALLEELLFEVVGPRAIGAIVLQGTPGKRKMGLFYEATGFALPSHRPYADRATRPEAQWSSHRWRIEDGVAAGIEAMAKLHKKQQEDLARFGWGPDHPRRKREYEGEWAEDDTQFVYAYKPLADDGGDWNQWDPKRDGHGFAILPKEFRDVGYGIGLDIGYKDAFALEIAAFSYTDPSRRLYHVYEVYRTRIYARELARLLLGEDLKLDKPGGIIGAIGWPAVMVGDFAGAGGALLDELKNVYGIIVKAVDKPYKYKDNSIELLNGEFIDGRQRILKGSALATELGNLQWSVDAYGKRIEDKGQANHGCDAWMYLRNEVAPLLPAASTPETAPPPKTAMQRYVEDDEIRPAQPTYGDADMMYSDDDAGGYAPGEW